MAQTKVKSELIDGGLGTDWQSTIQTSNFTAEAGKGYFVNTTSGTITISLPAGVVGTEIAIQDYAGTFATNKVIFASNGSEKIQGSTDNHRCIINNATVNLVYQDATKGWTADNIVTNVVPLTVSHLVIAGGGAGTTNQGAGGVGGGGAGGLRTSYGSTSGGGATAESNLTISVATNYTVTVGAGGTGANTHAGCTSGSNSVFSTITSIGGGKGGAGTGQGATGGSGGGSGRNYTSGGGAGTANQGYAGGAGGTLQSGNFGTGGGGGGAASVGGNGANSNSGGGNGGTGLAVEITGSAVTYAGGGGGGASSSNAGTGGSSIGGNGGTGTSGSGTAANANTASGGGGASGTGSGGAGGSGIVILRYPADYTLTNPGAGLTSTTATVGSDRVTTFTAGTGNIQFN
jgi:hypothetical protein